MGVSIRSTVKKAARLAVYDEIMISVKNHQALPTIRPDNDLSTQKTLCIVKTIKHSRFRNEIPAHILIGYKSR